MAVAEAVPVTVNVVVVAEPLENVPPLPVQPVKVQPEVGFAVSDPCVPDVYPPVQVCAVLTVTLPPLGGLAAVVRG